MLVAAAWAEAGWLSGEPDRATEIMIKTIALLPPDEGSGGWSAAQLADWCRRLDLTVPE